MRDFITHVLPHMANFISVSINYGETKRIQEVVMKSFGLKNFKDLRAKFEGLVFLNKFTEKIVGVIGVRKMLQLEGVDWENTNPKGYEPYIEIEGVKIEIVTTNYGKMPLIEANSNHPIIVVFSRENKSVLICGLAEVKTIKDKNNYVSVNSVMTKKSNSKVNFMAIGKLKPFKNIEELKTIIK